MACSKALDADAAGDPDPDAGPLPPQAVACTAMITARAAMPSVRLIPALG
jgi:hypothetical protein